jgi:hypothetical protein
MFQLSNLKQKLLIEEISSNQPLLCFLIQHGESEFNLKGRIGGDSDLSPRGHKVWNVINS